MRGVRLALTCALSISGVAAAVPAEAGGSVAQAQLARVGDGFWLAAQRENLDVARLAGYMPSHLPLPSASRCEADARAAKRGLDQLAEVDAKSLAAGDRVTFDVLRWEFGQRIEGARYCWLQPLLTPYSTPLNSAQRYFTGFALKQRKDLNDYRRLLGEVPRLVAAMEAFTRGQAARGIVLPRDELPAVLGLLDSYVSTQPFLVGDERLSKLDAKTARTFQAEVKRLVDQRIDPLLRSLRDYLAGAYREKAPVAVGLFQYPQGKDYYRYLVRYHTTLELTPEAVHERGLKAVAELEARMLAVRGKAGFSGSEAEFRQFLRNDRRFYAATPEEFERRLAKPVEQASAVLDRYFPTRPKAPYGLRRLDPALEGSQTFGYYDTPTPEEPKGYYNYNASQLDQRSLLESRSIILHELLPGHHLQLSLQLENRSLPEFRRFGSPTAYVEGWATYASQLGVEMGLYDDPYDLYGQLAASLFMAARLVVDTGMNYYGWPRERAMAYMREHLTLSEVEIGSETLRYAVDMPGQALAYRIGFEEWVGLRERAEHRAGAAFDLRAFHGCVLEQGSMPLGVLERYVDRCPAAAGGRGATDGAPLSAAIPASTKD